MDNTWSAGEDAAFWRRACQLGPTLPQRDLWGDEEDKKPDGGIKALPAA